MLLFALRLCWLMFEYKVPPELTVNLDETFLPALGLVVQAWQPKDGQSGVLAAMDKRGLTATLGITMAGAIAVLQLILKGKEQSSKVPGDLKLADDGEFFQCLREDSAWQDSQTFKELLNATVRYLKARKARMGLREEHPCIVVIDNYKAHVKAVEEWGTGMGKEFRAKGSNVQLGPGLCLDRSLLL